MYSFFINYHMFKPHFKYKYSYYFHTSILFLLLNYLYYHGHRGWLYVVSEPGRLIHTIKNKCRIIIYNQQKLYLHYTTL